MVQNQPFFYFFFLSNISQKNVFYNNIELKKAFLTFKKNMFKKSKKSDFSIEVSPWFWSKIDPFAIFLFLCSIGQKSVFYDILERKNAFLRNKKTSSKSRKIDIYIYVFPAWETHIPSDMCFPPEKHISLVICVPHLRNTYP